MTQFNQLINNSNLTEENKKILIRYTTDIISHEENLKLIDIILKSKLSEKYKFSIIKCINFIHLQNKYKGNYRCYIEDIIAFYCNMPQGRADIVGFCLNNQYVMELFEKLYTNGDNDPGDHTLYHRQENLFILFFIKYQNSGEFIPI